MNCGNSPFSGNYTQKSQILPILGEITAYLRKRKKKIKKTRFKTISHKKSRILLIFDEMIVYLHKKNCTFKINQLQESS